MMNPSGMRGLSTFIADLRACRSKEEEEKRINKELANVRSKFKETGLNSYQKKKYICKLLYIFLLGYDVDFGHIEAVNLINNPKYSEKQVGYLAVTLLLHENSEIVRLIINTMGKDLKDSREIVNCLALQAISNLASREVAESLTDDVFRLMNPENPNTFVRKKASLCLLRLYRKNPDIISNTAWSDVLCSTIEDPDVGITLSSCSLLYALGTDQPGTFARCVPAAVNKLHAIVVEKLFTPDNVYYFVPLPWLQVKLCKLLQVFPQSRDAKVRTKINAILRQVFNNANEVPKNVQHNNALTATIVEAINLCMHVDPDSDLVATAVNLSARYVVSKETNMKYIGLELMTMLASHDQCLDKIKKHREGVYVTLNDRDVSIRRRALDLLYSMCDQEISKQVVEELINHLPNADYAMKEDMVLKIAILTERFADESTWYVDIILKLIDIAGEHCSNEVWYRVLQIVTNNPNLHAYAARQAMNMIKSPVCNEFIVKVAAYLLGEFGDLIANDAGYTPIHQFNDLHAKFPICSFSTRSMLLNSYGKFVNIFPEIRNECIAVFNQCKTSLDPELQQRAMEYLSLASLPTDDLIQIIFEQMPIFPSRESALIQRLRKQEEESGKKVVSNRRQRTGAAEQAVPNTVTQLTQMKTGVPQLSQMKTGVPQQQSQSSAFAPPTPASGDQIALWFANLIEKSGGILYEDSAIQIGVKSEYQGPNGKITFFFGNKLQLNINTVKVAFDSIAGLEVKPLNNVDGIAPMSQTQLMISLDCSAPFIMPPLMSITYKVQLTMIQVPKLLLPAVLSKFCDPVAMPSSDYLNRWRALGNAKEIQEISKCPKPFTIDRVKYVLGVLKLSVLEGIDPNPANFVCANVLNTISGGKIGYLLRLECNMEQAMFRLTIRSTGDATSKPFCEFIKACLTRLI